MAGGADRPHVVIAGMMGAGKSTLGDALAASLGRPHRDCDRDLEELTGRSGAQIAADAGVEALHRLEAAVLLGALSDDTPSVISAAGSIVENPGCRRVLARRAVVVVMEATADLLARRIGDGHHRRPMNRSEIDALLERRSPLLSDVADLTVDATLAPEEIVHTVVDHLGRAGWPTTSD